MASGGHPDTLTDRHQRIARFAVQGWTNIQIGAELGLHPNRVSIIRSSPLMQAMIEKLRRDQDQLVAADFADQLMNPERDTRVLARYDELLDQDDEKGVAMRAVETYLDRRVPKKSLIESESTVRIAIDPDTAALLVRAMELDRDDVVDVTPSGVGGGGGVPPNGG